MNYPTHIPALSLKSIFGVTLWILLALLSIAGSQPVSADGLAGVLTTGHCHTGSLETCSVVVMNYHSVYCHTGSSGKSSAQAVTPPNAPKKPNAPVQPVAPTMWEGPQGLSPESVYKSGDSWSDRFRRTETLLI